MVERVGTDRGVSKGDGLVVFSGREIDVASRHPPEDHRGVSDRRYFVPAAQVGRQTWRYSLSPWKENPLEVPGRVIHYDPKYALVYDAMVRADRLDRGVFALLWLASPLLGFLPSRLKLLLEARFGFDPIRLTLFSLLAEYGIVLAGGFWLSVMIMARRLRRRVGRRVRHSAASRLGRAALAVAVLVPDLVARTARLLSRLAGPVRLLRVAVPAVLAPLIGAASRPLTGRRIGMTMGRSGTTARRIRTIWLSRSRSARDAFGERSRTPVCPQCGFDERQRPSHLALPPRTVLASQYIVGRVLGRPGGFGITYLGWDLRLETRVAIKEYLPRDLAGRDPDQRSVALHAARTRPASATGWTSSCGRPAPWPSSTTPTWCGCGTFFEANGTAYLVMD